MMMRQIEVDDVVEGAVQEGALLAVAVSPTLTSRGAGHQMSLCKTEINRESVDGIGSIYQNKVDSSLNSDSKNKEGVCYFLKSRLPTAQGTVNGKKSHSVTRYRVYWMCYPKKFDF